MPTSCLLKFLQFYIQGRSTSFVSGLQSPSPLGWRAHPALGHRSLHDRHPQEEQLGRDLQSLSLLRRVSREPRAAGGPLGSPPRPAQGFVGWTWRWHVDQKAPRGNSLTNLVARHFAERKFANLGYQEPAALPVHFKTCCKVQTLCKILSKREFSLTLANWAEIWQWDSPGAMSPLCWLAPEIYIRSNL